MMTSEVPERGDYFLWRLMIDARHQRRGYGREAMNRLIDRIKSSSNARVLLLSHLRANTGAGRFYRKLGFEYTGEEFGEEELMMSLRFDS